MIAVVTLVHRRTTSAISRLSSCAKGCTSDTADLHVMSLTGLLPYFIE